MRAVDFGAANQVRDADIKQIEDLVDGMSAVPPNGMRDDVGNSQSLFARQRCAQVGLLRYHAAMAVPEKTFLSKGG